MPLVLLQLVLGGAGSQSQDRGEGHPGPGSGHFIPEEKPAAVIEAILKFVGAPAPKA